MTAKAVVRYEARKRRFRLTLYVDGYHLRTFYWGKGERSNGWAQWAEKLVLDGGDYVG